MTKQNVTNDVTALMNAIANEEVFGISPFNLLLTRRKLVDVLEDIAVNTLDEIGKLAEDMVEGSIKREVEDMQKAILSRMKGDSDNEGVTHLKNLTGVYRIQSTRALFFKLVMMYVELLMNRVISNDDSYLVHVHLKAIGVDAEAEDDMMYG